MDIVLLASGAAVLVALGLFAYLIGICLKYQQESSSLTSKQAQLHQQCARNTQASDLARSKATAARERSGALDREISQLRAQLVQLKESEKDKDED